jgi:hypothetical protein
MEEVALLLEINRRFPEERDWDEYEVFIRNGYIRTLTDHVKPSLNSGKLLTPRWAIDKGNEIGGQNKRELIATRAQIVGDLESLDTSSVPEGESVYPTQISIEVVSQAMLGFNRKLVSKLPISWVKRSFLGRYKGRLKRDLARLRKKL